MDKRYARMVYGVILICVGLGVFYRIPDVSAQVSAIEFFSTKMVLVKFCFYVLGTALVIAGGIRLYKNH